MTAHLPVFPEVLGGPSCPLGSSQPGLACCLHLQDVPGACCAAVGYLPYSALLVSLSCPPKSNAVGVSLGAGATSFEQAKTK